ncbi:nucleotide sugar dehydrogenase [Paenibacillus sp. N3.4]|uniref:nucleotide sugar dehydrogenase n=1 Tax=Paenibacillus sp. N3.4 TaxID=2603222 RepID=UPI0011C7F1A7|nr:nucleotide sugar dehydrogenase [Paenibacillus sp. N3.4]TXK84650.1 nucleotide sugar dehydrogenase [Paenibacillus sp. N3.4]
MASGSGSDHSFQQIAVIGQGYVGLPLALLFVNKVHTVFGIDVDPGKIEALRNGKSYLPDVMDEEIVSCLATGRYYPTDRFEKVTEADAIIICVPTPLNSSHSPDLTILEKAVSEIGKHLRKGQLVILESSTYPGTTREILQPMLELESGLTAGIDFHIGYSPERIDPGNENYKVEQIPKIISGLTKQCAECAQALYSSVFDMVVRVSSTDVAELTKLLENSYRLINISFMNEIAAICDKLNIDVWEVIEAAKTKPFGFTAFYPGPGIGGHCIPVDPLYLQWRANKFGTESKFIQLSDEVNRSIPNYIVNRVRTLLSRQSEPGHARVLIYGVAYKKDINDVRESPALDLIRLLVEAGLSVSYHDPYIPEIQVNGSTYQSVEINDEMLQHTGCVIIFTDHSAIPLEQIVTHAPIVFDTRNVTAGMHDKHHVYRLGAGLGTS